MSDAPPPVAIGDGAAERLLAGRPRLRAINFHCTPTSDADRYRAQLAGLGARFGPVDEDGLERLLEGQPLAHRRPGLVPVLYEGYRSGYEVLLDLIEREGLIAWCFVPPAFVDAPPAAQHAFAEAHEIALPSDAPERVAMTWDELRDVVARGHVVACHTASHAGIADVRTGADVERELAASKARLEDELGVRVRTFAWLWGSAVGADARLDAELRRLGYRFVFSNAMVQRLGR